MGDGFFWKWTLIEASPFNALWENTTGKTDFPLIANHPASK
jgi:hypothetical protein